MNTEATTELQRDASSLAYSAIRHSGLYKSLSPDEWDAKAAVYGHLILELLNRLIDEDFTAIEAAKQEAEQCQKSR